MKLNYKRDLKDKHETKVVLYSEKHAESIDNSRKDDFCTRASEKIFCSTPFYKNTGLEN